MLLPAQSQCEFWERERTKKAEEEKTAREENKLNQQHEPDPCFG